MKVGIKIYGKNDFDFVSKIIDKIDFIETMAIQTENYDFLKDVDLPKVIHNEHSKFGFNLPDASINQKNMSSINFSIELANRLNAKHIVIHPGMKNNETCSKENIINVLSKFNDNQILLETMPYKLKDNTYYFYDYDTIAELLQITKCGFVVDFGHVGISAKQLGKDPVEFIKKIMTLNPNYFHFCDTNLETFKDHLHLGEGTANIEEYKKMISDKSVCIETKPNVEKVKKDIEFLRS